MNFNESVIYRGYTIIKRKSICDDCYAYYSIRYGDKYIGIANTLLIAKIYIDERILNKVD